LVSEKDSWTELKDSINELKFQYLVVKIPPSRTDLIFKVHELGLVFVELITRAHYAGQPPVLSDLQKRIRHAVCWGVMTNENRKKLFAEISQGLFKTDRIAIDPSFGITHSSNRYLGWISDELISGANLFEITKGDELIGFFMMKRVNLDSYEAILAGLLEKYQKSGLGFILNHLEIEATINLGANSVYSTFSSNNRGAIAIHMAMGYTVDHQSYVYVKHSADALL